MRGFAHVDTWVFDLDNTLYPASCRLFDQIDVKMGDFVSRLLGVDHAEAKRRQKEMFYRHGTTLHALPGRKLIFPHGTVAHAEKVLNRIGITHHFGDIFDIVHADFIPKPEMEPYRKFVHQTGIRPGTSAMFEDIARNLLAPHELGMTTVLVTSPDNHDAAHLNRTTSDEHIHHVTGDLPGFLSGLAAELKRS